jgi:hypothetical protein
MRSLQGCYFVIKQCCSIWSACLEQVRNAPPSGCTDDDYVSILIILCSAIAHFKHMC